MLIQELTKTFYCMLQNQRGMTVSTGMVKIEKDPSNMIGISIGGGAPFCPCLYIVQVTKPIITPLKLTRTFL